MVITGRPSMVNEQDCSVSLPSLDAASDSQSPSAATQSEYDVSQRSSVHDFTTTASLTRQSSSYSSGASPYSTMPPPLIPSHSNMGRATPTVRIYFQHYNSLCILAKQAVHRLYHPGIRARKWTEIQTMISNYSQKLYAWRSSLMAPFNGSDPSLDPTVEGCRVALKILYNSTLATINRPSLCRFEPTLPKQSRSQSRTGHTSANKCIESAQCVIELILHKPESTLLRYGAMWWMLLHHMKRAVTVLLLELAFRAEHMPDETDEILTAARQAIDWLYRMSLSNPTTRQTWATLHNLCKEAAKRVNRDPNAESAVFQELNASQHALHQAQRESQVGAGHITQQQGQPMMPFQSIDPANLTTGFSPAQYQQQHYPQNVYPSYNTTSNPFPYQQAQQQQGAFYPNQPLPSQQDPQYFPHQQSQPHTQQQSQPQFQENPMYFSDLAATSQWDQFGFLGGSMFPQQDGYEWGEEEDEGDSQAGAQHGQQGQGQGGYGGQGGQGGGGGR